MAAGDIEGALQLTESVAAERISFCTEPGFDRERYASRWRIRINATIERRAGRNRGRSVRGVCRRLSRCGARSTLGEFVDKDFRGCGVGKQLLNGLIAWARGRGLPSIACTSFRITSARSHCIKSAGFVEITGCRITQAPERRVWEAILMTKKSLKPEEPRGHEMTSSSHLRDLLSLLHIDWALEP